jgi:hypothetical protein
LAVTTDLMTGWPSFPAAPAFVAKALEYWFARFKPGDDGQGLRRLAEICSGDGEFERDAARGEIMRWQAAR